MSARMQVPLSQRRHTNIAVVRYSKNGVKLEIACYKNKVISYRSGTENRLDEVLQVERIFANVARGYLASEKEIQTVFGGDMTELEAIKYMLNHGELQVAQQERTAEVDEMFKDIAVIISQKCINTKTQRPFPSQVIEQALRSIGAAVKLDQPVKKQALSLMHLLIDSNVIPIARANMKIRCTTTSEAALEKLRVWCRDNDADVEKVTVTSNASGSDNGGVGHSLVLLMQPNLFRDLDHFIKEELPSGSTTHMVDAVVTEIGDLDFLLDAKTVSSANAQPGRAEETATTSGSRRATATASLPSAGGVSGGRTDVSIVLGWNAENASSEQHPSYGEGQGGRRGKIKSTARHNHRGRRNDDSDDDDLLDSGTDGSAKGGVTVGLDIAAELHKLNLDPSRNFQDDSDDDGGRGRGGKGKRNKKNASGTGGVPPQSQVDGAKKADVGAIALDDNDESDRKGKKTKKNAKKGKKVASAKSVPEVEKTFSDSDEELMGNRKQRAKKQQEAHAQQGGNDWEEEDFDYGEEEEVGEQVN
ncbi:ShwachmanBodianDiamond syndrome [Leishmania braziliensis]|nr:ShwachmanBodianDiamond syndrome [Leishmania braziliensis]